MIPKVIVEKTVYNTINIRFDPDISLWYFPNENRRQFARLLCNLLSEEFHYHTLTQTTLNSIKAQAVRIMCAWISNGSVIAY